MVKSKENPLMSKFQLKTYLFNVLYPNMGNLNFHIWKYLNFLRENVTSVRFGI